MIERWSGKDWVRKNRKERASIWLYHGRNTPLKCGEWLEKILVKSALKKKPLSKQFTSGKIVECLKEAGATDLHKIRQKPIIKIKNPRLSKKIKKRGDRTKDTLKAVDHSDPSLRLFNHLLVVCEQ